MPIFSYLAIPTSGAKEVLCADLTTDTPDEATEEALQKTLKNLQSLQSLSLTFGCDDKEKQKG